MTDPEFQADVLRRLADLQQQMQEARELAREILAKIRQDERDDWWKHGEAPPWT